MKFTCHGHPHMKASHASTFEFTKEKEMTTQGTCILGVHCDFSLKEIEKLIEENDFIEGKIKIEKETVSFFSKINKDFCHQKEIVFRKSGFLSERTLGIFCDKSDFFFISEGAAG